MGREKYLVRVVRPVFQAAYVEVEACSERDAEGKCFYSLYTLPESEWRGRYNPDEHAMDFYCLPTLETEDGFPYTRLGYAQYSILNTDLDPFMVADGLEVWMREVVHPMLLAARFWGWIGQMNAARDVSYQKAIERCEERLRDWRGTDHKVVALQPPADRRDDIELVETTLACLRLLKEMD
jgi:hypothetical protein